jgi:hypothetical protein
VLRATHFSIGHFSFCQYFFDLRAAPFLNAGYFRVSDACNSNQ